MQNYVSREVFPAEKSLVAVAAAQWLLTVVDEADVLGEAGAPIECACADVARVRVLAGVVENVSAQLSRLDERLAAELARVRFLARVDAHVTVERLLCRKRVTTLIARNKRSIFIVII